MPDIKIQKQNKKRTLRKSQVAAICILIIVAFGLVFYFSYVYLVKLRDITTVDNKENSSGTEQPGTAGIADALLIEKIKVKSEGTGKYFTLKDSGSSNLFELKDRITAGEKLSVEMYIKNNSNNIISDFQVVNTPPGKFINAETILGENSFYDPFSKKIIWKIDELKSGETKKLEFKTEVSKEYDDLEEFENRISILAEDEILEEIILKGAVNAVPVYSDSEIEIVDVNGGDIWAGDTIEYKIRVKNTGGKDGSNLILTCPFPPMSGYIQGSETGTGFEYNNNTHELQWKISRLKPGEEKEFSFRTFIADYVTFETEIKSEFFILDDKNKIGIQNPGLTVKREPFMTIICMGDSQIELNNWPERLDELLEIKYPHAEFNVISSGVEGESAKGAISRFDRDVRMHNPDIIVLGYGSNDAGEVMFYYIYHMELLVKQAISTGAKVFAHGTGSIDISMKKWEGKDNYMVFNTILKEDICPENGAIYIDIYNPMSKDPEKYLIKDGLHWSKEGADLVTGEVFNTIIKYLDKDGNILENTVME